MIEAAHAQCRPPIYRDSRLRRRCRRAQAAIRAGIEAVIFAGRPDVATRSRRHRQAARYGTAHGSAARRGRFGYVVFRRRRNPAAALAATFSLPVTPVF